jgi:hypothetical protein
MILDLAPMATAIHKKIERSSKFGRMKRMKLWLCNMYMNMKRMKRILFVYIVMKLNGFGKKIKSSLIKLFNKKKKF